MSEPFLRRGDWWSRAPSGEWLRWNEPDQAWEKFDTPPPPPDPAETSVSTSDPTQPRSTPVLVVAVVVAFGLIAALDWLTKLIGLGGEFANSLAASPLLLVGQIQKSLARMVKKPALGLTPRLEGKSTFPWHYMGVLAAVLLIAVAQLSAFVGAISATALFGAAQDASLIAGVTVSLLAQVASAFAFGRWMRRDTTRWLLAVSLFAALSRPLAIVLDYLLTPSSVYREVFGIEKGSEALLAILSYPGTWVLGVIVFGVAVAGGWSRRQGRGQVS